MTSSFILIYKSKELFASHIKKIIIFKNFEEAYQYGLKFEPYITKQIVYSRDDTLKNSTVWVSNQQVFPKYKCSILEIPNDILWNIYHSVPEGNQLMNSIVKALRTNSIL